MVFPSLSREYSQFENLKYIAGVDEVGRGCIAGPVVSAILIVSSNDNIIPGVNDSKKVSEKRRNILSDEIKSAHEFWAVGAASNDEIDKFGIVKATHLSMLRAYWGLEVQPDIILMDGKNTTLSIMNRTYHYAKGDAKVYSIAAASIIAKVHRDNLISDIGLTMPEYDFANHKGYGTKKHYESLRQYGISDIHRKTFLKSFII